MSWDGTLGICRGKSAGGHKNKGPERDMSLEWGIGDMQGNSAGAIELGVPRGHIIGMGH